MANCFIIADDLTGANATGALFARQGFKTLSISQTGSVATLPDCDVWVYNAGSRGMTPDEARKTIYQALLRFKSEEIMLYGKRIDSTLRGHLGVETDAMLDILGEDWIAAVVPAFPIASRIVCGGYMLVNNISLEKTSVGQDSLYPVSTPDVNKLFSMQSRRKTAKVTLGDYAEGVDYVANRITQLYKEGIRILIFDAVNNEDLKFIAHVLLGLKMKFLTVDPGPFSVEVAVNIMSGKNSSRLLLAIGSISEETRIQVKKLLQEENVGNVYVDVSRLIESEQERKQEIKRVVQQLLAMCDKRRIYSVVGSGLINRIDLKRPFAESRIISDAFGQICASILLSDMNFKGILACGGDIAYSIYNELNADALMIREQIVPLAVYGELLGGKKEGLKFASKGGMVGAEKSLVECVQYMLGKI